MHNNVVEVIFSQDEIDMQQVLEYFLECVRCHYIWPRELDYRTGKVKDPIKCPCCRNPWFTEGKSTRQGPKAPTLETGGVMAWRPLDGKTFISRPDWLNYCRNTRKNIGNPLLPISLEEYESNKNFYIRLRDEFMKNVKEHNSVKGKDGMLVYQFFPQAPATLGEPVQDEPINKTA